MARERSELMTAAQKASLEAELAELEGPRRTEIVKAIANARSFGDLSENFEYHAAKNEQGMLERQITILRDRIERAVIIEEPDGTEGVVAIGSRVEIADDQGDRIKLQISSVGGVSPDSPVGRALLGRRVGEEVKIEAPSGAWRAHILSIG